VFGLLFGLSIFGFPIVSTLPVIMNVDSTPISVAYRALVLGLSLLAITAGLRASWPRVSGIGVMSFSAILGVMLARLSWDSVVAPLPLNLEWGNLWLYAVGMTILPAAVFLFIPTTQMLRSCYLSTFWLGVIAVLAIPVGVLFSVTDPSTLDRLQTDVLNPISVGNVGVSLVAVCLADFTGRGGSVARYAARVFRLIFGGLGAAVALLSGSKGPVLALVVIITMATMLRGAPEQWRARLVPRLISLAVVLAVLASGLVAVSEFFPVLERFMEASGQFSTAAREQLMSDALLQFEESPVLGSATVEYNQHFYPHNILVESLMVGGVAGFAALAAYLVVGVHAAAIVYARSPQYRWLVLLAVQYLTDSMFSGALYLSATFWISSMIVIAVAQRAGKSEPALGASRSRGNGAAQVAVGLPE
jgi:O-antigen ligase